MRKDKQCKVYQNSTEFQINLCSVNWHLAKIVQKMLQIHLNVTYFCSVIVCNENTLSNFHHAMEAQYAVKRYEI